LRDYLKKRPMLLCAILSSVVSVITMYAEKMLFIVCTVVLGFIFIMIYKRVKGEIIFAFICVLAVALSCFFTTVKIDSLRNFDRTNCDGEFVIIENPTNHGEYYSTTAETLQSDTLSKGDKIKLNIYKENLSYGDKFKARLSISSLDNYEHKDSFYAKNIFVSGYITKMTEKTGKEMVLSVIGAVRNYVKNCFFDNFQFSRAATALALITGDKTYFTDEFYSNVKSAGVAHIMVVSGMHLSIVVSLFLYLIDKFLYNRYLRAGVIFAVSVFLMAICGFTMSILRAGITYMILALSLIIKRQSTPENTLGCAVVIILLTNPFAIFSIGFLLSVLSTFSILVVAVPVTRVLTRKRIFNNWAVKAILGSVIISFCALIFTAPVTIYTFGYISNVSLATNLLLSAASSVALVLCISGLVLPFLQPFLFWVAEFILAFINNVINDFGSLPFATTSLPKWSAYILTSVIIIILWVLLACKKRKDMLKLEEIRKIKAKERSKKIICQ